jgi:hypothetical protein
MVCPLENHYLRKAGCCSFSTCRDENQPDQSTIPRMPAHLQTLVITVILNCGGLIVAVHKLRIARSPMSGNPDATKERGASLLS